MMRYTVGFHKDPDSDYGVTVPDLPGCFSAGESIDDVLIQAVESIECHLEGLLMDNEAIPLPTSIEVYVGNPDYAGASGRWSPIF